MGNRKERSDKKRAITCSVSIETYEIISKISYICNLPIKSIGESLVIEAIQNKAILQYLNQYFRRSFTHGNITYCGDMSRKPYRIDYKNFDTRKIHMRFRQDAHERISVLAYALDCSVSTAASELLESAIHVKQAIINVVARHISEYIDHKRRVQLRELLRFINNDDNENKTTLSKFINILIEECFDKTITLKHAIRDYLD